jgi:putative oxidoreductase
MGMEWAKQITYLLLRLVSGLMFFQHGGMKIFDWFGGIPADKGGHPAVMSQVWIGGWLEILGGILVMLGLFTRPAAFIVSGEMAVAYWMFHARGTTWPIENQGELAVLYCFVFLFMAAYGGGTYSLDARMKRKRSAK